MIETIVAIAALKLAIYAVVWVATNA